MDGHGRDHGRGRMQTRTHAKACLCMRKRDTDMDSTHTLMDRLPIHYSVDTTSSLCSDTYMPIQRKSKHIQTVHMYTSWAATEVVGLAGLDFIQNGGRDDLYICLPYLPKIQ